VLAQLVKAVKRLAADVAYKRVEVWIVVIQSWLSLVHAGYVALLNKAVTWSIFVIEEMTICTSESSPWQGIFFSQM
jgi:hypothetical protein